MKMHTVSSLTTYQRIFGLLQTILPQHLITAAIPRQGSHFQVEGKLSNAIPQGSQHPHAAYKGSGHTARVT